MHVHNGILHLSFQSEEKKLESAEKYLEQSASMFDEFLKENDKNSVEAIKMYETSILCFIIIIIDKNHVSMTRLSY